MRCIHIALLVAVFCWQRSSAQGVTLPKATDIKFSSINFKTILEWKPEPTNYTYTVLIRNQFSQDWKKKCINIKATTCDVSDVMRETHSTYDIRIVSEVESSETVDGEPPYADGPSFNPYEQTIIGTPTIQDVRFNKDESNLTIVVKDPVTPYRNTSNNTPMTVRDIFKDDYIYTVVYRKASSSGKKERSSGSNEIVIQTEKGSGYCFYVQATIRSRKQNREGERTVDRCISSQNGEFDITILVAVGIAVALIVLIIVLSVILCKCRNGKKEKSKETKPLNDV